MGRGPASDIEEILDRQGDAVKRREVVDRRGPQYCIGCRKRGFADLVVSPVAEGVDSRVELVDPLEVAIDHLGWAHFPATYGRGEFDGWREWVNRVAHHELSFPIVFRMSASSRVWGCVLDKCRPDPPPLECS